MSDLLTDWIVDASADGLTFGEWMDRRAEQERRLEAFKRIIENPEMRSQLAAGIVGAINRQDRYYRYDDDNSLVGLSMKTLKEVGAVALAVTGVGAPLASTIANGMKGAGGMIRPGANVTKGTNSTK